MLDFPSHPLRADAEEGMAEKEKNPSRTFIVLYDPAYTAVSTKFLFYLKIYFSRLICSFTHLFIQTVTPRLSYHALKIAISHPYKKVHTLDTHTYILRLMHVSHIRYTVIAYNNTYTHTWGY